MIDSARMLSGLYGGIMDYAYEGFYARFDTAGKDAGFVLGGADTLVGDVFTVDFRADEDGSTTAWLINRFGGELGFVNAATTYKLQVATARGLTVRALLSFVAYTEGQNPSPFWGEVAVVCTPDNEPLFDTYVQNLSKAMAGGVRPNVDLSMPEIQKLVESQGTWVPVDRVDRPAFDKGTALVKDRRSVSENMIEQSRKGNIGCYAAAIICTIAIVVAIGYFVGGALGLF